MSLFGDGEREIAKAIRESTHELLYKRIPRKRKITKQERVIFKKMMKEVNENIMMTDLQKAIFQQKAWLDLTTEEVERFA